jgi:hypothetical protein
MSKKIRMQKPKCFPAAETIDGKSVLGREGNSHLAQEKKMKAIVQDRYGAPDDVLELTNIDMPAVKDDEVLVRVHSAAVHVSDWVFVRGVPYITRPLGSTRSLGLIRSSKEE